MITLPQELVQCRNLVGGEWLSPSDGNSIAVESPYSGEPIGYVGMSSADEVKAAVDIALRAFADWRAVPIKERTGTLLKFRELTLQRLDELANLAAAEAGKTVAEARAGVLKGVEVIEFAASLQNMDQGGALEVSRGVWCQYKREPLGVVVGITPFNFPAMVPLWLIPIATTVGNCFVHKPSEKVPLSSQVLGELMLEAGYPPGVYSIVNGAKETVDALVEHPDVAAIAFVGSTPVARLLYSRATQLGKRALCLGGAKNHMILTPDADPDLAVKGIVDSFTGCAGQRCMAGSVLLAVGDVDQLIDKIVAEAGSRVLGSSMGAIIDRAAVTRIRNAIARGCEQGASLRLDGRSAAAPTGFEKGFWLGPSILDCVLPDMECACCEIFGPVLSIVRVPTLSAAMEIEALNSYGNATSVFTSSGAVAQFVTSRASSGMVGVNIGVPVPREPFSFGGTKESKFGHGEITGPGSLSLWSDLKKITTKWTEQIDRNWMS